MKKNKSDMQKTKNITIKSIRLSSCIERPAGLKVNIKAPKIAIPAHARPVNFDWPAIPLKTPTRTDHKMIFFKDLSWITNSNL